MYPLTASHGNESTTKIENRQFQPSKFKTVAFNYARETTSSLYSVPYGLALSGTKPPSAANTRTTKERQWYLLVQGR